jgi:hypothetical protein
MEVAMRHAVVLHLFIPLLVPTPCVLSQERPSVETGTRIRITAPAAGLEQRIGRLTAIGREALEFEPEGQLQSWTVPIASVTRLEVGRGRKSNSYWGAVIGAGAGLVWATFRAIEECPGPLCEEQVALGSMLCTGGGAIIGSVIGLAIRTDRWEEVPLERLRVTSMVTPDGRFGLAASLRF